MKATAQVGITGVTVELSVDEAQVLLDCLSFSLDLMHEDISNTESAWGITLSDYNTLCSIRDSIASINIEKK
jgi:hypothetical protein